MPDKRWPRHLLILLLIVSFSLSACGSETAEPATPAVVSAGTAPALVSAGSPVQVLADFGERTEIVRAELWLNGESLPPAGPVAEAWPDPNGRVRFVWTPGQAGPFTLEIRAYDGAGQLQLRVFQQVRVLEAAVVAATEIETTSIIDITIPDRIVDMLLPRILDKIQIGDEPIVISSRAILFFLYLMLAILVLKIISGTLLNWSQERRAAQLAEIDLRLRQLDLERAQLEFLRQQQATETTHWLGGAEPGPPSEALPLSPTERRRLQYLRQHPPSGSGERNSFLELAGGLFFGSMVGLVSSLIIAIFLGLLGNLLGGSPGDSLTDFIPNLIVTGLYLGLLLGLAGGLINIFSDRAFFSPALQKFFTTFTGRIIRLVSRQPSKPAGCLGRALGGGLLGIFYGGFYGLLLGLIGAGVTAVVIWLDPPNSSLAAQILAGSLILATAGTLGGGVVGGVGGVLYGLWSERLPQVSAGDNPSQKIGPP